MPNDMTKIPKVVSKLAPSSWIDQPQPMSKKAKAVSKQEPSSQPWIIQSTSKKAKGVSRMGSSKADAEAQIKQTLFNFGRPGTVPR